MTFKRGYISNVAFIMHHDCMKLSVQSFYGLSLISKGVLKKYYFLENTKPQFLYQKTLK